MIEHEWRYLAKILRIVDGDTYIVEADLGFTVRMEITVRLLGSTGGVNTPELHAKSPIERSRAVAASLRVAKLIPPGTQVRLRTQMDHVDGFRRYLAEVITEDGTNIGDLLLAEKLADVWSK